LLLWCAVRTLRLYVQRLPEHLSAGGTSNFFRLVELLFAMSDFVSGEKQTEVLPGGTPSTVAAETAPSSKPVEDNPSEAQPQQVTTRVCASCTT
jgi:hypothetical protein